MARVRRALLERIPGVVSATIEGSHDWVTAVRIWYESTWPVRQVMAAVDECLIKEGARLAATRFEAVVAEPDRRAARRPRPEHTPARPAVPTTSATLPRSANSQDTYLRLVGHKKEDVEPGVMGVQVWIEWQGRTFSGAATGPRAPAWCSTHLGSRDAPGAALVPSGAMPKPQPARTRSRDRRPGYGAEDARRGGRPHSGGKGASPPIDRRVARRR